MWICSKWNAQIPLVLSFMSNVTELGNQPVEIRHVGWIINNGIQMLSYLELCWGFGWYLQWEGGGRDGDLWLCSHWAVPGHQDFSLVHVARAWCLNTGTMSQPCTQAPDPVVAGILPVILCSNCQHGGRANSSQNLNSVRTALKQCEWSFLCTEDLLSASVGRKWVFRMPFPF